MSFYAPGNPPRTSTQAAATNPSTAVLLAEILNLGGEANRGPVLHEARIVIGCSTSSQYWVEQCLSSGLGSTALSTCGGALGRVHIFATVNQSAQYVLRFVGTSGDRLRVRPAVAITGDAAVTLQVEVMA